ncbi:MAG: ABC-2 family transporter protein [Firmicutes bacterium]|nr:ABC-2 family transporter protein [Candidatus Fermentithermobacillaceae bacterium]
MNPGVSPILRARPSLVKDLLVARSALVLRIKRMREYSLDFLASAAFIPITMLVTLVVWRVVFGTSTLLGGYTFSGLVSYYLAVQLVSLVVHQASPVAWFVWQDINSGNLGSYLARPLDYQLLLLGKCAGPVAVYLPVAVLIYRLAAFIWDLPVSLEPLRLAILSGIVAGGFLIWYLVQFICASLAFWIGKIDTLRDLVVEVFMFFSGAIVPNDLLPGVLGSVGRVLPSKYMLYVPVSVITGRISLDQMLELLREEYLWVAALFIISRVLWARGTRRFEAQGG